MSRTRSRRSLLRTTAGIGTAVGIAGLAGCSSVPFLGGDGSSSPRGWLYDPTGFIDDPVMSIQFESPSRIHDERDRLHPEVRERHASPMYVDVRDAGDGPDPAATDWAAVIGDELHKAPFQYAYGGSFDREDAREAARAAIDWDVSARDDGTVEGLQYLTAGPEHHGAYRDGLAVSLSGASREAFERLVAGAADGTDRLADVAPEVETFLDALGFDHTAQASLSPRPESEAWQGTGTTYRIDGGTTTARQLVMNQDGWDEASLREFGGGIDGLREVSVESDGPVRWIEGVADTDRDGLNGDLFQLGSTPSE